MNTTSAPAGRRCPRAPEAVHDQPRHARDGALLHPPLGLPVIEEEVARLVERDALQQAAQHG